jgi:hypothetical protein
MKKVLLSLLSLTLVGCNTANLTNSQKVKIYSDSYVLTVNTVSDLYELGVLDNNDLETFNDYRKPVRTMLDQLNLEAIDDNTIKIEDLEDLEQLLLRMKEFVDGLSRDHSDDVSWNPGCRQPWEFSCSTQRRVA